MAMFAVPAAISVAGGVAGYFAGKGDRDAADALNQAAYYQAMNLPMPPDLSEKIAQLKYVAEQMPESKVAQMVESSGLQDVQNQALKDMQQRARTGYNAQDIANSERAQSEMNTANMAAQNSIMQGEAMRGTAGANANLAARLTQQQGAANRGAEAATANAANANKTRGEALQQVAGMASGMRNQDLNFNQSKYGAADQFALQNFQNRQNIANKNVDKDMKAIQEQGNYYDRLLGRAGTQIGATQGYATAKANQGAAKGALWSGIGSGVGQIASAGVNQYYKAPAAGTSNGTGSVVADSDNTGYYDPDKYNNKSSFTY